jgi:hypothetical protein
VPVVESNELSPRTIEELNKTFEAGSPYSDLIDIFGIFQIYQCLTHVFNPLLQMKWTLNFRLMFLLTWSQHSRLKMNPSPLPQLQGVEVSYILKVLPIFLLTSRGMKNDYTSIFCFFCLQSVRTVVPRAALKCATYASRSRSVVVVKGT